MQTVLPDPMVCLARYINVLYNDSGTQTWPLIHSSECCSQLFTGVSGSVSQRNHVKINMLDLMVEMSLDHCIIFLMDVLLRNFCNILIAASQVLIMNGGSGLRMSKTNRVTIKNNW